MKILHGLTVVHGHPTGKPACISIPDQLHFRKKVKHSLLLFNSRMRLRSCVSPADCRSPTRAAAWLWAADESCVSLADCRLLRPRCGRALGCRRVLCVSCRLSASRRYLVRVLCALMYRYVRSPSGSVSARDIQALAKKPWVPCRSPSSSTSARDTQVLSKALGTLPQPLPKHICKRHTGPVESPGYSAAAPTLY